MRKFLSSYPKWIVFGFAGLLGAGLLNCACELFMSGLLSPDESLVRRIMGTGVWFCFPTLGVTLFVFLCQRVLLDADDFLLALLRPMAAGAFLGFLSGVAAECLFQSMLNPGSGFFFTETLRTFAWGLAGAGLGLTLSMVVPNLQRGRAATFGFVGGLAGGIGFTLVGLAVRAILGSGAPDMQPDYANIASRLVGTSIIGLFVGLSVAVAEATAKEGYLRVVWGPGEFTRVNLGEKPVTVGSSRESTVRMAASAGYPPIVATFSLQKGQASMVNHMSRTTHVLRNGNKLTLGKVVIEVHLFS